jgi:hypothetical protein
MFPVPAVMLVNLFDPGVAVDIEMPPPGLEIVYALG